MKTITKFGDKKNKVTDTSTIFKFCLWDNGVPQDVTGKTVTATIANTSGFLFDIDLVSNGTEIDLDFKDSQLQKLTPDTYFIEIKVTDEAGDVSIFPTEGYTIFTINKNLHATEGALVPQITFDTVLADVKKAMDEKVADYTSTIAKGDKGDSGPAGKDAEMPVVGGRNLLLHTGRSFTGVGNNSINGNFYAQGGNYFLAGGKKVSDLYNQYGPSGYLTLSFDWVASGDTISGRLNPVWLDTPWGGLATSDGVQLSSTNKTGHYEITVSLKSNGYSTGIAGGITFRQDNLQGNITISNMKLEAGNVATDWTPAPEDAPSNDAQLVHNTGNESIAGDKTFTGSTTLATTTILAGTYGLRVTSSGFQKTTDGKTWVSANI